MKRESTNKQMENREGKNNKKQKEKAQEKIRKM